MKTTFAMALAVLLAGLAGMPVSPQDKAKGSWQVQNSAVTDNLHAVAFASDQIGVAVGANRTILRTTDGGKTWKRVMGPEKQGSQYFAAVLFLNDKVGWVRNQLTWDVYRTADAGASWQHVKTPKEGTVYHSNGFAAHAAVGDAYFWQNSFAQVGGNKLYKVSNNGGTWTPLWQSTDGTLGSAGVALAFPDPKEGWMASIGESTKYQYFVGRSSDGGKTWKKQEIKDKVKGASMLLQAVDKDHGWCVSSSSNFVHASSDGGKSWSAYPLDNGLESDMAQIHFTSVKVGHVLCGPNWHVRQSTDGGLTWRSLGKLNRQGVNEGRVHGMFFPNANQGWVVGARGYIARFQNE